VYVLGQRVHEVALGLGILAVIALGVALNWLPFRDNAVLCGLGVGGWLVIKDWRDLVPRWRNTQAHRRFGLHLPHGTARCSRLPSLPTVAAAATLAVAAVNAASALTPTVGWRGHLLLTVEPVSALPVFHAIAVPASIGLGLTAVSLYHRRRRALLVAVALLLLLGVANQLKGLDFEEAGLSVCLAGLLWYGRRSFDVEHERFCLRATVLPLAGAMLTLCVAGAVGIWMAGPDPSMKVAAGEAASLLSWQQSPIPFDDSGAQFAVRLLVVAALFLTAWTVFRPRRPSSVTDASERRRARQLVLVHGRDTLAPFKLRRDLEYLFSPAGDAFLGYRAEGGAMLVAGDPVGPESAVAELMEGAVAFARSHGLRLGAVGASEAAALGWRGLGLRAVYVGDEAIVDAKAFTLEGRPIRKVRQSISRLEAAGYTMTLGAIRHLPRKTLAELEAVSARWRGGEPERGFAMATTLADPAAREGLVAIARDPDGAVRGWLLYLPTFGRAAMSLALMRRDRDTPNGLMEFLVARSVEALRNSGVDEVSLNFAAFARSLRDPHGLVDRVAGRVLALASRWYQIESLYRFNAKFFPRWEPRYLVFESRAAFPRIGLATLVAEGQAPKTLTALYRANASV
jgi:lysyl-tRNA synthetase class 2